MSRKRLERKPIKETENHYSVAAENAQKRNRERKIVRRVYSVLSVLVAVLMFYYLMKPAITLEAHPRGRESAADLRHGRACAYRSLLGI